MATEFVEVLGATLKFTDPSITGTIVITSSPSTKLKYSNKGAFRGTINVLVSGASQAGCVQTGTASGTMDPTAEKNTSEGDELIRKGDQSNDIIINGLISGSPCSFTAKVEIDDPGQDKAKAE